MVYFCELQDELEWKQCVLFWWL